MLTGVAGSSPGDLPEPGRGRQNTLERSRKFLLRDSVSQGIPFTFESNAPRQLHALVNIQALLCVS